MESGKQSEERVALKFRIRQRRKGIYEGWPPALTSAPDPQTLQTHGQVNWEVTRHSRGNYDLGSCKSKGEGAEKGLPEAPEGENELSQKPARGTRARGTWSVDSEAASHWGKDLGFCFYFFKSWISGAIKIFERGKSDFMSSNQLKVTFGVKERISNQTRINIQNPSRFSPRPPGLAGQPASSLQEQNSR